MIRQATGDPAGALEAITEARQAAPGPAGPAQPGPGPAGPAAAGPGRPGRRGPFRRRRTASARTTSQTTPANPGTWCWPGSCSPRTGPARRSHCWTGCTPAAAAQDRAGSLIEIGALRALALAASRR